MASGARPRQALVAVAMGKIGATAERGAGAGHFAPYRQFLPIGRELEAGHFGGKPGGLNGPARAAIGAGENRPDLAGGRSLVRQEPQAAIGGKRRVAGVTAPVEPDRTGIFAAQRQQPQRRRPFISLWIACGQRIDRQMAIGRNGDRSHARERDEILRGHRGTGRLGESCRRRRERQRCERELQRGHGCTGNRLGAPCKGTMVSQGCLRGKWAAPRGGGEPRT